MSILLGDLVTRLGGTLIGDANISVVGIAPLTEASSQHITFLTNVKLRNEVDHNKAAALILSPSHHAEIDTYAGARIVTDNPYAYFARTAQLFEKMREPAMVPGISSSASVASTASIAATACIGPHVVIEDDVVIEDNVKIDAGCFIGRGAKIGKDTHFFANVTFHRLCEIGQRGVIHSGAVIGSDGFGFANDKGVWIKIPQVGRVVMGNDVDVGANACIDRGALVDTVIEDGVKLDNQIQIGHNCRIGAHTAIAGCVGIAGSTTIGQHCTVGGAAMISGHLNIVDGVHIAGGSVVIGSIKKAGAYAGMYPLAEHRDWEKTAVIVRNLAALRDKLRGLEKLVTSFSLKK